MARAIYEWPGSAVGPEQMAFGNTTSFLDIVTQRGSQDPGKGQ